MEKIIKIIKINLLSIIALPLLLIATTDKLVSKATEKLLTILCAIAIWGIIEIFFAVIKNPKGVFEIILLISALLIIGVIFVMIFQIIISISVVIFGVIAAVIMGLFNFIYELTYSGYTSLYNICKNDYEYIEQTGNIFFNKITNIFFTLLKILNKLIIAFTSVSLKILIVLSTALVGISLVQSNTTINKELGISLFRYLTLFKTFDLVHGIVLYIAFMGVIVVILVTLGIQ